MSKIDYQALREAAEKATPGNWWIDSHGQAMVSFVGNDVLEVFTTDNKRAAVRHEDTGNLSRWRNDNDATFIATANPATVLALLDELDKWKQESSAWQAVAEKQLALAASAEQKISELESLTAPQLPQTEVLSVPDGVLKSLLPDAEKPDFWFEHNGKIFFEGVRFNNAVFEACCAAMLQGSEPETDNANQQFESLSRGDK